MDVERINSLDAFTVPVKYPMKQRAKTSVQKCDMENTANMCM